MKNSFNFKFLLITAIYCLLSFASTYNAQQSNIASATELQRRKFFYSSLINEYKLAEQIEVTPADSDLVMKSKKSIPSGQIVLAAETRFFFSSCDFFPFIETVVKALLEFGVGNDQQTMANYLLVYNMLYFKYGNYRLAEEYYKEYIDMSKLTLNSYVKFARDDLVKQYLFSIPNYSVKSQLKFTKEDEDLAKNLHIELSSKDQVNAAFDFVLEYVNENTSEEIKNAMHSFIDKREDFINLVSLLNIKKFMIREDRFPEIFYNLNTSEYYSMKDLIFPPNFRPNVCRIFGPFIELIKYTMQTTYDNKEKAEVLFRRLAEGVIGFSYNRDLSPGDEIRSTVEDKIPSESHLLNSGKLPKENIFEHMILKYKLSKSKLNPEQVNFCHSYGCGRFDIKSFYTNSVSDELELPFPITKDLLNFDIINLFKVLNIKNPNQNLLPYVMSNVPFNHNVEAKSLAEYMNILNKATKKVDISKVVNDYIKVKRMNSLKNGFNNEMINELLREDFNTYDFNLFESMYKLTIQKRSIINVNILETANLLKKNSLSDIKKMKKNFITE